MEKRRAQATPAAEAQVEAAAQVTANDVMTRRCIRFGNQHQLREATWLMSEMQKHIKQPIPQPLFLQDREGRLFGRLTTWRMLKELADGVDANTDLTDVKLVKQLRRHFDRPITDLATTDLAAPGKETGLAELIKTAVARQEAVIPICDEHRRIIGMVDQADLMKGIARVLKLEADAVLKEKT